LTKTLFALMLAMAASAAQASDPDRLDMGWFKDQKLAMATPPQAAPQQTAQTPPSTSTSPATTERPADQLLRALVSGKVSVDEERRIGDKIAGNFLGAVKLVPNDGLQHYVNLVGRWVALQSERPDLPWRFGVVDSDDINAFAAPGGYVFVTKGLYRRLANEADLAGVLGHEIGHVIRKHQIKVMQKSKVIALAAGLLGKQIKDENQLIQNLVGNGAEIMSRSLDKEAEFEADRVGMVLAARAGYDAYALPKVLEDIGHVSDQDSRVALLFKTHPRPSDRFDRLAEAVGERLDNLPEGKSLDQRFYRLH